MPRSALTVAGYSRISPALPYGTGTSRQWRGRGGGAGSRDQDGVGVGESVLKLTALGVEEVAEYAEAADRPESAAAEWLA